MKRLQQMMFVAVVGFVGLGATPALASPETVLPSWYGFIGGPRVCDDVNPDGWCVSWHWELKESAHQRAQRLKSHRHAQLERLRAQDGELSYRPIQPKMIIVNGDSVTEEPTSNNSSAE